ncbi:hypothetical protein HDV04_006143 [Boothiomyces sp. JEL0838]|nr:hypothetical protein HDV04_006123 [Boothiomyces sp. JEL0838]KAJ3314604.1 hypothetical protein HDV04_006143 [Boothiomyces sp. JEL0838]
MEQGESSANTPETSVQQDEIVVIRPEPLPEYQQSKVSNSENEKEEHRECVVDVSNDESQAPPDFNEAMRPKNQSHRVKGVALLLLPFYILFYEIPVWIWTVMLPAIGNFLSAYILSPIWSGLKYLGRGISFIALGIWSGIKWIATGIFNWIFIPIRNVIFYIGQGIFFILKVLVDGIAYIFTNIWKGLCFVAGGLQIYILLPIWNGLKFISSKIWGGITFISSKVWNGIKWICNGIYAYILLPIWTGVVYIITGLYRGITFILTNIWKGIVVFSTFILDYILVPIWQGICFIAKGLWSGLVFVVGGIWTGITFIFKGISDFILLPLWKGICFISSKFFVFISNVFHTCGHYSAIVAKFLYTYFILIPFRFLATYLFKPLWNGLKWIGNGIKYVFISIGKRIWMVVKPVVESTKRMSQKVRDYMRNTFQSIHESLVAIKNDIKEALRGQRHAQ